MFKLISKFSPSDDQKVAIEKLSCNLHKNAKHQTLWGITGSGKTFSVANVIAKQNKPTLVIAHNKTLAAQLADEFRQFFPHNAVHYFVSYYDYYQPEAYIPHTDTYIEKDSSINDEIDRLRHATTHALLTRSDVIIVASVSCIYGIGSPEFYRSENLILKTGEDKKRTDILLTLNNLLYLRNDTELKRGTYSIKGEILEIFPAYSSNTFRIEFFGNQVEKISEVDWISGQKIKSLDSLEIFPAKHFVSPPEIQKYAISNIRNDLAERLKEFKRQNKLLEAQRLEQRTNFDLEMLEETGYCSGIENYSRYFDGRKKGDPPITLIDYLPKDFLLVVDESHITIPQIRGMFGGDFSRKEKLIEYGFRLPSAYDNRPLKFDEFSKKINQAIYTSATPADYEIEKSQKYDAVIRQFIRPTGLLDPKIKIKKTKGQIEDLIIEIDNTVKKGQRVLVTTLTKKMSEALTDYLLDRKIKVTYLHSDIETIERSEILHSLRLGEYDVLVGINLLREGLDLPEVSLVAILDADKEGFLRSHTSLVQTMGRAARHKEGRVIMYADVMTDSMKKAIDETNKRRKIQEKYNMEHNITPRSITKTLKPKEQKEERAELLIEKEFKGMPKSEKRKVIRDLTFAMNEAAKRLEFEHAAHLRDQISLLEEKIKR